MHAGRVFALGAYLSIAAAVPLAFDTSFNALEQRDTCASLYVIVARGSYEPVGEGSMGPAVAARVCAKIPGCVSTGVTYPANMATSAIYIASESQGSNDMLSLAQTYHQNCSQTPIVLMGYSQGAQVVGDTLCGHSESGWTTTSALSGSLAKAVIASVQFGDPTFVAHKSWNMGTSVTNGVVTRQNVAACQPFASIMQSYCDTGDPYCAGGDELSVHTGYMSEYGQQAANFVLAQYSAFAASSTTATTSSAIATSTLQATSTMPALTSTVQAVTTSTFTTFQTSAKPTTTAAVSMSVSPSLVSTPTIKKHKTKTRTKHATADASVVTAAAVAAVAANPNVIVDVSTVINVVTVVVTARAEPTA